MKQAIVARTDIGMGTGKLAAQIAHAALSAYEDCEERTGRKWKGSGQKKVVLKGESESQLFELADAADREGIPYAVVRDAGHTQLDSGTVTALAIGPSTERVIDSVTGDLSLF